MKKYTYGVCQANTPKLQEFLQNAWDEMAEKKKTLPPEEYHAFLNERNGEIRRQLKLPNAVFALGYSKNEGVKVLLFDAKPDGAVYEVKKGRNGHPYIEVEGP